MENTVDISAEVLQQCCQGDHQAFRRLVGQLMRPAYYHALALVGNSEDALDVSQDAFSRAWSSWSDYDPSRPFYPWYYAILKRLALNVLRSRRRHRTSSLDAGSATTLMIVDAAPAPDEIQDGRELAALVNDVLARLPLDDREILCLKDQQDYKYWEIAELLGIPQGTVMSRLYSARVRFRALMQEGGYEHA